MAPYFCNMEVFWQYVNFKFDDFAYAHIKYTVQTKLHNYVIVLIALTQGGDFSTCCALINASSAVLL